jgi:hypothetical protein
MNGVKQAMLAISLVAAITGAAAERRVETTIKLTVPKQVTAEAAARAAGDASASAPILMLEGLEVRQGEGMTIEVLGPPAGKSKMRPILAVSGLVGSGPVAANAPMETMTLVVPLNDRASRLLARTNEITLTLHVRNARGRAPLKVKRAYLAMPRK